MGEVLGGVGGASGSQATRAPGTDGDGDWLTLPRADVPSMHAGADCSWADA